MGTVSPYVASHASLRDDPRTLRLVTRLRGFHSAQAIGHLHLLWWWAAHHADDDGKIRAEPEELELAACWPGESGALISALTAAGFLALGEDGEWVFQEWERIAGGLVRARELSRMRVQKNRTRPKRLSNAHVTVEKRSGNAGETQNLPRPDPTRPDQTEQKDYSLKRVDGDVEKKRKATPPFSEFVTAWNETASRIGLPTILPEAANKGIRSAWAARHKDPGFADRWPRALALLGDLPFLLGENDRGWRANPEFFLRDGQKGETVANILGGKYQNGTRTYDRPRGGGLSARTLELLAQGEGPEV